MNTYGTRLGIIRQVLGLGYKELLERLDNCVTDRSLRNYIENKTQMPGDIISRIPEVFPEINRNWWHTGEGKIQNETKLYVTPEFSNSFAEPEALYEKSMKGESVSVPASELFKALFKDMTEVNRLLQSRLEYYDIFIKNMDKFKI
jgi:hypothetical protein